MEDVLAWRPEVVLVITYGRATRTEPAYAALAALAARVPVVT